MIRFKPLPLMTVLFIVALGLLIWLGRWQWERYDEKTAAAEEPLAEMTLARYEPIPSGLQFVHGVRTDTREQGWRVFAPVQFGETVVFVDSDFINGVEPPNPDEVRFPASLGLGAPITGASLRPEPPAPLTLSPRPLQRLWFAIDLPAMGRNAGLENVADYYIATAYIGTDGRATANPFAMAPGADALPPVRHLGYAITWYGLALVMFVIYFAYHISVQRLAFAPQNAPED